MTWALLMEMLLFTGIQALATVFIFHLTLKPRYFKRSVTFLLASFFIMIWNILSQFFPYFMFSPLLFYILWLCIIHLFYKGKLLEKVFLMTCLTTLQMLYEGIYFETYDTGISFDILGKYSLSRLGQIIMVILICCIQTVIILWVKKRLQHLVEAVVAKLYFIFFAQFSIVYLALTVLIETHMERMTNGFHIFEGISWSYVIGIPLFVAATIIIIYSMMNNMIYEHERFLVKTRMKELDYVIEKYRRIEEKNESIRKLRHDIRNHLRTANELINIDTKKANEYISMIKKEITEL